MRVNELKQQAKIAKWHERVVDCRSSGMSVRAWCEMQKIAESTYYRWENMILNMADGKIPPQVPSVAICSASPTRPAFVELPAPKKVNDTSLHSASTAIATIHCGPVSIDIYPGAETSFIVALCKELQYAQ